MRTKTKLLSALLGGVACVAAAFAFVILPKAQQEVVHAETSMDWVDERRTAGKVQTYAKDPSSGMYYSETTDAAYACDSVINSTGVNPWENIVQMNLTVYSFNDPNGPSSLFFDGGSGAADKWNVPLIYVSEKYAGVRAGWNTGYDTKDSVESNGAHIAVASGKTFEYGKKYNAELAFGNVFDETETTKVIGYTYYFKLWSGEDVLWNFTKTTKTKANINFADSSVQTEKMTIGRMFTNIFSVAASESVKAYSLESDKDISYYWDNKHPNNEPIEWNAAETTQSLQFGSNNQLFAEYYTIPEGNTALSFRFKAESLSSTGLFTFAWGSASRYNGNARVYELDYTNNKIRVYTGAWKRSVKEVPFTLEVGKNYELRFSNYYDAATKAALWRLQITDIETKTSASVYTYDSSMDVMLNQLNVFYGISSDNWVTTDASAKFTISAASANWGVTVTDGSNTATQRTDKITLPSHDAENTKTFIGWASEGKFYKEGAEVVLTKNTTFTAMYLDFHMVQAAAVRVTKGEKNATGLRFKGNVNMADWTALTASNSDIGLYMIIERGGDRKQAAQAITAEDCYEVAGETNKEFAVVIDLPENENEYFSTVYAAKAFIKVTYEGDTEATYIAAAETAKNSVQNVAQAIIDGKDSTYAAFWNALSQEQKDLLTTYAAGTPQN